MRFKCLASAACVFFLASCGGESGGSTPRPTPTPANSAPSITSADAFSVAENASDVAMITGSDPESSPLSFSIAGGVDASAFEISSGGALAFVDAPDFENPTDDNGDNIYSVVVTVSDGSLTDSQTIAVTVTDLADQLSVVRLSDGCGGPTPIADVTAYQSDVLMVCWVNGRALRVDTSTGGTTMIADFSDNTNPFLGSPTDIFWDEASDRLYMGWDFFSTDWKLGAFQFDGTGVTYEGEVVDFGRGPAEFTRGNWIGICPSGRACVKEQDESIFEFEIDTSGGGFSANVTLLQNTLVDVFTDDAEVVNDDILVTQFPSVDANRGVVRLRTASNDRVVELEYGGYALHPYQGPVAELDGRWILSGDEGIFVLEEDVLFDGVTNPRSDFTDRSADFAVGGTALGEPNDIVEANGRTFILDSSDGALYEIVGI